MTRGILKHIWALEQNGLSKIITDEASLYLAEGWQLDALQVREFVSSTGIENIGKRLVNSREGRVEMEKPRMNLDALLDYGNLLVDEQENVKRVQLAESYMSGSELAGRDSPRPSLLG